MSDSKPSADRGAVHAEPERTEMPQELLACPFCGGRPYATKTVNGTQMFKVGCSACGFKLKAAWYLGEDKPTKDLIGLWNTRAALGAGETPTRTETQSLRDCYVLARRRMRALYRFARGSGSIDELSRSEQEAWSHIIRFCENAGLEPDGVLRDGRDPAPDSTR